MWMDLKYRATHGQYSALVTIARQIIYAHCGEMVMKKAILTTAREDTTRDLFHIQGAHIVKRPLREKTKKTAIRFIRLHPEKARQVEWRFGPANTGS